MTPARPALALLALLTLANCSSGPTEGEILEAEKGSIQVALGLAVAELEPQTLQIGTLARRNIAGHSGLRQSDLWNLEFHAATLRGSSGELIRATLLKMPLSKPWPGAALYLAFDGDGRLVRLGSSGHAAFDQDRDHAWAAFLSQFEGRQAGPPSAFLTSVAAYRHWHELQQQNTPEQGLALALYEQKRLMASNGATLTRVLQATGRGELPSPGLLRDWNQRWQELAGLGASLAPLVGPDPALAYQDIAAEARELLAEAIQASSDGNAAEVRRLAGSEMDKRSCRACHNLSSSSLGGRLRPSLETRLADFGAPDLWRVGQDLWAPTAMHDPAQKLASRVKAGLMVVGELRRDGLLQAPL